MVHLPLSMLRPNLLKISESAFASVAGAVRDRLAARFIPDDEREGCAFTDIKGFSSLQSATRKSPAKTPIPLKSLAIPAGFEPATHGVEIRYSDRLRIEGAGIKPELSEARARTKTGRAISATDVTHFFDVSPKVGQRQPDCCEVPAYISEINNGSPGLDSALWSANGSVRWHAQEPDLS